ncbi:MAG: efflux RND transporter periplasmic adaptor subunit [Desulfobacteraceae bacterium]
MTLENDRPFRKKRGYIPLIILFVSLIFLGMCTQSKKDLIEKEKKSAVKETIPPINVVTMEMKPKTVKDRLSLPGTLAPFVSLEVSSETAGMILKKNVNIGDNVQKGAVLAEIDGEKYSNAYKSAKASYENAVSTRKRLETLYRSELSNKSDLDTITAQMENAKSAMKIAAVDLEKTMIKAPDSGIVNKVYIEKGQFTDVGKPAVEIIRIDPIKVNVGIPESDVNGVTDIKEFDVTVDALMGKTYKARKHSLSRTTSSLARVYDLELTIKNPSGDLLPDMFVRVNIVKKQALNAFAVPLYSVISLNDKKYVYVADKDPNNKNPDAPQDTAIRKEIITGIQDGWMVEVKQGLATGDDIITVGQRSVTNGQKVHIIRTQDEQENLLR